HDFHAHSEIGVLVHVNFYNAYTVAHFGLEFVEHRVHGAAGSAPGAPEVEEDRGGGMNDIFERGCHVFVFTAPNAPATHSHRPDSPLKYGWPDRWCAVSFWTISGALRCSAR